MKLITAIIRPFKLVDVKEALKATNVYGMTVMRARVLGRRGGHTEVYRGAEYTTDFLPKLRLEIVCDDDELERIVDLIEGSARTGKIGDGKLWFTDVGGVRRIRTGERGSDAL